MTSVQFLRQDPNARTLIVSLRKLHRTISRTVIYELEDAFCRLDGADMVAPTAPLRRMGERARTRARLALGMRAVRGRASGPPLADRRYDLLLVSCEDMTDLLALGPMERWLSLADRAACYVEEVWAVDVPKRPVEIGILREFDRVFSACAGATAAMKEATGVPFDYLGLGCDARLFVPGTPAPTRCIDFYAMGRRPQGVHRVLQDMADERGLFYLYDTFTGNRAIDVSDHRRLLASFVQRTRYFVAYRAKFDEPDLTAVQEEVGARHYEGAAGGAILIGQPPRTQTFTDAFPYADAVVTVGESADELRDVIAGLDADPDRVAALRHQNMRNCLLRHDWAYRWQQVLEAMGMAPRPAVAERLAELRARAEAMGEDTGGASSNG